MKHARLTPTFVEYIPERLSDGVLYVSMAYATAAHNCACGCGREVTTPISPTDWQLQFDGVSVSLSPSIGNWEFPCRSHYWIRRNAVVGSGDMSSAQIERGRRRDRVAKQAYYGAKGQPFSGAKSEAEYSEPVQIEQQHTPAAPPVDRSFWRGLIEWLTK